MCVIQANDVDVMCFHFEPHLFSGDDKKCCLLLMLLQAIITISSFCGGSLYLMVIAIDAYLR